MSKFILAAVVAAAVCVPAARAADLSNVTLSQDHRVTSMVHPSGAVSSEFSRAHASGLKPIFSNIGWDYPKGRYISNFAYTISGPTSIIGEQVWLGSQFTPKKDGMVVEVDAALGYVTGTMGMVLSLYTDAGGVPGTSLGDFNVKKLPIFGTCCALVRAFNSTGAPVTAGTPYWVVVTTNSSESDEWGVWNMNDTDQVDVLNGAVNTGTGWGASQFLPAPSFAVFGG